MRRVLLPLLLLIVCACAAPAPEPQPVPEPVREPVTAAPVQPRVIGSVTVTASALNVRREPSTDGDVVMQVKRGERLDVLARDESWVKVRLGGGEEGWVAARFVSSGETTSRKTTPARRRTSGCPADSDYAFSETPTLRASDRSAHGLVVIEATVNASGTVTSTKLISNATGDETLAFLAQQEIKSAKFSPPIRNCVAKPFIFTYRRTF